jgi:hypothetical protein
MTVKMYGTLRRLRRELHKQASYRMKHGKVDLPRLEASLAKFKELAETELKALSGEREALEARDTRVLSV